MNNKLRLDCAGQRFSRQNKTRTSLSVLLLSLALLAAHATPSAPTLEVKGTPEQVFQMALEAQTAREYSKMLTLLRQSSEASNVQAQEVLSMVLLTGPTLFGDAVKSDRCEAGIWMRRAAAQGSEIAKHQLVFLNRLRQAPSGKDVCSALGK